MTVRYFFIKKYFWNWFWESFYVKQTWKSTWKTFFFLWENTFTQKRAAGAVGHSGHISRVERQTRVPVALLITFAQGLEEREEKRGKTVHSSSSATSQNTLRRAFKKKKVTVSKFMCSQISARIRWLIAITRNNI